MSGDNSIPHSPKTGLANLLQKSRTFRRIEESLKRRKKTTEFAELNESVWQDAYKRQLIILGKEDKEGIDWSHFDFMVAQPNAWNSANFSTPMEILRTFWKMFYPYLSKLVREYEQAVDMHNATIEDSDDMLKKYVQMIEEFKYMEAYIDDDAERKETYKFFRKRLKDKIDSETELLKAQQSERDKEEKNS